MSDWPERIDAETHNAIHDRAGGKCECADPTCSHAAGKCPHPGNNVAIGKGTPKEKWVAMGRFVCKECFAKTESSMRQWPQW
jgi:hypothetical protein